MGTPAAELALAMKNNNHRQLEAAKEVNAQGAGTADRPQRRAMRQRPDMEIHRRWPGTISALSPC
jgi:hypothetical protein